MEDDIRTKSFPENYSSDAVRVLDTMSFTRGKNVGLLGSMSIRSQQYAGDYDAYELVNMEEPSNEVALHMLAERFKEIIKDLQNLPKTFIGDIKAGSVEEWRVLPRDAGIKNGKLVGMDVTASLRKLDELEKKKVISPKEAKNGREHLQGTMTPFRFLEAKQYFKFHIVRWNPQSILQGYRVLRDNRKFTLEEAFSTPSITKVDVISFVQNNRYTDFSMIYYFRNNGKLLNPDPYEFVRSIKENILYFEKKNNPFKVLKRKFALAKFMKDADTITKLTPILNSDLGRIYHVLGDIGTLIRLLEDFRPNAKTVKFEIDQFKNRLSNVYQLKDYLKDEHTILGEIESALKDPKKSTLLAKLRKLEDRLQSILNKGTMELKGGAIDPGTLDLSEYRKGKRTDQTNAEILESLEKMLRSLAHFYENRDPATALGFRVLADDLFPRWKSNPEQDERHRIAQEVIARKVLTPRAMSRYFPSTTSKYYPNVVERNTIEIGPLISDVEKGKTEVKPPPHDARARWNMPPETFMERLNFLAFNPDIIGFTMYR